MNNATNNTMNNRTRRHNKNSKQQTLCRTTNNVKQQITAKHTKQERLFFLPVDVCVWLLMFVFFACWYLWLLCLLSLLPVNVCLFLFACCCLFATCAQHTIKTTNKQPNNKYQPLLISQQTAKTQKG